MGITLAVSGFWALAALYLPDVFGTSLTYGLAPIPYVTAWEWALSGTATTALVARRFTAARLLAGIVILIGALRVIEYVGQFDPDEARPIFDYLVPAAARPGRMASLRSRGRRNARQLTLRNDLFRLRASVRRNCLPN